MLGVIQSSGGIPRNKVTMSPTSRFGRYAGRTIPAGMEMPKLATMICPQRVARAVHQVEGTGAGREQEREIRYHVWRAV
jgi:hypothetical protein